MVNDSIQDCESITIYKVTCYNTDGRGIVSTEYVLNKPAVNQRVDVIPMAGYKIHNDRTRTYSYALLANVTDETVATTKTKVLAKARSLLSKEELRVLGIS
tara:strand:+ start:51 stop:353 length:303 start_codon:yes stop_codon:yes gene_type:complete